MCSYMAVIVQYTTSCSICGLSAKFKAAPILSWIIYATKIRSVLTTITCLFAQDEWQAPAVETHVHA